MARTTWRINLLSLRLCNMLQIIISADTGTRTKKRMAVLSEHIGEMVVLDDMTSSVALLEEYVYPSLFSIGVPVVHAKYLIEESGNEMTKELLQKLVSSPTLFLLEEKSITSVFLKMIEKEGGSVHQTKEEKKAPKLSTIFDVTNALTLPNKKERWLAYQKAKGEHQVEALVGILYWKLRQLIEKSGPQTTHYKNMYHNLMQAHKRAWQKGFPLELAVERVILEQ